MGMRCIFANGGRAEPIRPRNRKRLRPYMASQALVFSILQNRNSMAAHPCEAGKANCKTEAVLQCRKNFTSACPAQSAFPPAFCWRWPCTAISHSQRGARPGSGLKLRRLPCHIRKRGLLKGAKAVESLREAAFSAPPSVCSCAPSNWLSSSVFTSGMGEHLLEQADYEQISELDASITFLYRRGHNTELLHNY